MDYETELNEHLLDLEKSRNPFDREGANAIRAYLDGKIDGSSLYTLISMFLGLKSSSFQGKVDGHG